MAYPKKAKATRRTSRPVEYTGQHIADNKRCDPVDGYAEALPFYIFRAYLALHHGIFFASMEDTILDICIDLSIRFMDVLVGSGSLAS
jgi:hypothetical protein